MNALSNGESVLTKINTVVLIVLSVIGGWINWNTNVANEGIARVESELKVKQEQRASVEDIRDLKFKLFEKVSEAIEKADANQQLAAKALVVSLLEKDDDLRLGLLEVLTSRAAPAAKERIEKTSQEENVFSSQEKSISTDVAAALASSNAAGPASIKGYFVDVFYCESADANLGQANKIQEELKSYVATARSRLLPASVNSAPGMRVSGLQIRHGSDESVVARSLKQVLEKAGLGDFELKLVRTPTKNYLSAFVCN